MMDSWARKLRGALGTAVTWGIGWAGAGVALSALEFPFLSLGFFLRALLFGATFLGAAGFLAGGGFALLLSAIEGRRSFRELSLARTTAWGFAGGAVVPFVLMVLLTLAGLNVGVTGIMEAVLTCGVLGGLSSAGSLLLARRGAGAGDEDWDFDELDAPLARAHRAAGALGDGGLPDPLDAAMGRTPVGARRREREEESAS